MTRPVRLLVGALVLVIAVVAWWWFRSGSERAAIDLVDQFPSAKIKRPNPEAFEVVDATLAGQRLRAIFAKEQSRAGWDITVPDNAWLKVSLGLKEEAWTVKGDGVFFMIGVSDGTKFDELYTQVVNPFASASDRRWNEVLLDLSPYAGKTVELVFNTRSSPPATPGNAPTLDSNGDLALWGAPRIVIR